MRVDEERVKSDCGVQICKVIYPEIVTCTLKNLKNAINFHPDKGEPCKNSWYQDVRSTHVRNKRLLDLPRKVPRCCADIYNMILDRQKLKKLQKYGLSRPVRTRVSHLEMEKVKKCKPEIEVSPLEITPVDCVLIPESDSNEEEEDEDDSEEDEEEKKKWLAEAERRCSQCYTMPVKKKAKMDWKDLLHGSEEQYCKEVVRKIMAKYKGHLDAELKLRTRS